MSSSQLAGRRGPVLRMQAAVATVIVLLGGAVGIAEVGAAEQVGHRGPSYVDPDGSTSPTGEKPESKLWFHDGRWWGALIAPSGRHTIHRLDGTTWVNTGVDIAPAGAREDVVAEGNSLFVVSRKTSTFSRYTYANGAYLRDAGFPVPVPVSSAEALTLAREPGGTLWLTWEDGGSIWVTRTNGTNHASWVPPYVLPVSGATGVSSDDISAVISFDDGRGPAIGVMWSNQSTDTQRFAIHRAGAGDMAWSVETALSGTDEADDHINMKTHNGQIFSVVKTSKSSSGQPLIRLLVRSSSGAWSNHVVAAAAPSNADDNTRPITMLEINPDTNQVYVFMTLGEGTGARGIVYKRSNISNIAFPGAATPFIVGPNGENINDATSMKANASSASGIVVMASDGSDYWWNKLGGGGSQK